jgi:hypothetical protein
MKLDITAAVATFYTLPLGAKTWAERADGKPIDPMDAAAVKFNKSGAIIRAVEQQVGRGRMTNRMLVAVERAIA